jgi:hypothetical protein
LSGFLSLIVISNMTGPRKGEEINLVNDLVIVIRDSLDAHRRDSMKEILVQSPAVEVALALDEYLSKTIGDEFSLKDDQLRWVAIILALKELGLLTSHDRGRETLFFVDPNENSADGMLLIKLKKSEMLRSVELAKRIVPTLKQWRRAAGIKEKTIIDYPRDSHEFELDPFVSQLALWVDKEVTIERPEFKFVDLAERTARICLELQENGVAIMTSTEVIPVWATTVTIDLRIGGANISHNARFTSSSGANAALLDRFQKAVKEHLKRRLASMLDTEEAFFKLCNMGKIKIAGIDPGGLYRWVASKKRRAGANVRRKISKTDR